MGIAKKDAGRVRKAIGRSWMSSTKCVEALSQLVIDRQRAVSVDGQPGAFSVIDLVDTLKQHADAVIAGGSYVYSFSVTLTTAILGELLGAAEFGDVYQTSSDPDLARLQGPLQTLRNVVCHPADVSKGGDVSFLDKLLAELSKDQQDADHIRRQKREVQSAQVARWALVKLNAVGMYELGGIVLDGAATRVLFTGWGRKNVLDTQHASRMEQLLDRASSARSEDELLRD